MENDGSMHGYLLVGWKSLVLMIQEKGCAFECCVEIVAQLVMIWSCFKCADAGTVRVSISTRMRVVVD